MKRLCVVLLLLALHLLVLAQSGTVTGTVTDESGTPVAGAAVYWQGQTGISAVTNFKGEYSIKSVPGGTLVFSCMGYKDELVNPGGQAVTDVTMRSDILFLDEAVAIGYGTQQRQDLTGAIASVRADELRKSSDLNVLGALQGKVAGLNIVSQSGEPGAGYSINIRGNNSINASTAPLVVVDGVQMDINAGETASSAFSLSGSDPLAFLNPVDIQSIEVLKDASATAIYGSRGAGGVILVTTKSGTGNAGKTAVTFDASFNITETARDLDMLDGQEWIDYRFARGDNEWWYYGKDTDGDGVPDTPKTLADYGRNAVNWRDVMFRKAFSQQYNVSVRANSGEHTRFLSSLGWLDQQGLIVNNGYTKLTAKVKIDHDINDSVKMGVNANYARTKSTGAATSSGGSFTGYGLTQLIYLEKPIERFEDPADPASIYTAFTSLYDCISSESSRTGVSDRLIGNAYLDWKILPSLTLRTYASGSVSYSSNNEFYSSDTRWGHSTNGLAQYSTAKSTAMTANATLTWKPELRGRHHLTAMGGAEVSDYMYESYLQQAQNFEDPSLRDMALAKGTLLNPVQVKNTNGRMSAFGRLDYNWDWRYYLTFNMRSDGSSRFSAGSRVGWFPSVSAAWRISNEPWMRSLKSRAIDNLKLRISAGASGNDRISNYANLSTLDKIYYSDGNGSALLGMAEWTSGNSRLKWETTWQYDAGIDVTLWKGRVDMVFDTYYKDTRDMLFMATIPSQTGFTSQWQNIGNVSNRGIELSLNTVNVKDGDFIWESSLTFARNRNKILSLGDGVDMMANNISKGSFKEEPTRLMVGQPIGIIYGYVWDGNYQLEDFDIYWRSTDIPADSRIVTSANYNDFDFVLKDGVTKINGVDPRPGDRKLKDLNGDGIVKASDDKTVIGKCDPDFTWGIANTFTWRNWTLHVFFDGVYGRDILNETKNNVTSGAITNYNNITRDAFRNAWTPENGSNKHARLTNQINCQQALSSYYVENGSFIKLRTLSLSCNFPSGLCRALHLGGLKATVSSSNVYTWTKYSGLDPDFSSSNSTFSGIDRLAYPNGRTYTLGVVANF